MTWPFSVGAVTHALKLFFQVAEAVCNERMALGLPKEEAAPVLLFDEVRDRAETDACRS